MNTIILILILLTFLAGFYIYTTQRLDVHLNVISPTPVASHHIVSTSSHSSTPISFGSPTMSAVNNNLVPVTSSPVSYMPTTSSAPVTSSPVSYMPTTSSGPVASSPSSFDGTPSSISSSPVSSSSAIVTGSSMTTSSSQTPSSTSSSSTTFKAPPIDAGVVVTGSGVNELSTPSASSYSSSMSPPTMTPSSVTSVSKMGSSTTVTTSQEGLQNKNEKTAKCPNILVKSGEYLLLYNTTDTHYEMPVMFNNLDEYGNYIKAQRANGIYCPVLHLQQENNAQGQDVFRIKSTPFNDHYNEPFSDLIGQTIPSPSASNGGLMFPPSTVAQLSTNTSTFPFFNIEGFDGGMGSPAHVSSPVQSPASTPVPIPVATMPPSNTPPQNQEGSSSTTQTKLYPGFDPYGFDVGKFKELDKIHESTAAPPLSDNPMDPNWGGTEYTKEAVNSGKYIENSVYPVTYSMPGGVQFYPGLYQTYPDPPNFVKPVGGATPPFLASKTK